MASLASPRSLPLSRVSDTNLLGPAESLELSPMPNTVMPPLLLEFTCFSRLPAEIRCGIWKLTMLPRNVDICVHDIGSVRSNRFQALELYSTTPVPVVLHVSQESRAVGLTTYNLCFGTAYMKMSWNRKDRFTFIRSPSTYFSYQMDTANFKFTSDPWRNIPTAYMNAYDLERIRHVRVDWRVNVSERLIRSMASFKGLKTFSLSWFWQAKLGDDAYDSSILDDIEVTEETYELPNRPDIHQFMDSLKLARDIFAPNYQIPILRIKSLNNKEIVKDMLMVLGIVPPK